MTTTTEAPAGRQQQSVRDAADPPLPWPGLLVLGAIAFVALVSEIAPAGLLRPMAAGLEISESRAGLLVTAYALSAGITAIPAIALTRGWPRRRLLLGVVAGFALVNLLTAVVTGYAAMIVVRLIGGLSTGLLWSLVGNYAARLVAPGQGGRALTIAMGGGTVGFSLGVPGASALGSLAGWRITFDADLRRATLRALAGVLGSLVALAVAGTMPVAVLLGAATWGLAYGGLAALTQTAAARVGGAAADISVSVAVTSWSIAIAAGAFVGGAVLDGPGIGALPWAAASFLAIALAGVTAARRHGFPPAGR